MPSFSIASSSSHQVHPDADEHELGHSIPPGGNREGHVAFTSASGRGEFIVVINDSEAGHAHGTSDAPAPATSSRLSRLIGGVRQWAHTQSQHLKGADLAKAAATEFVRAYLSTAIGKTVGGLVEQQVENWVLPRPNAQFALATAWPAASAVVNAAFAGYAVYGIVKAFEKPERPRNQLAVAAGGAAAGVASLLAVGPVTALVAGATRAHAARFAAEQLSYAVYAMVREASVFAMSGFGPELKSRKEDGSTGSLKLSFGSVAISVPLYSASSIAMNYKGSTAFKNRYDPPTLENTEGGDLRYAAVMQKGIAFDKMFANPFVEGLHQAVVVLAKAAVGHAPTVVVPQGGASGWLTHWRDKQIKTGTPAAQPNAPDTAAAPRFQFSTWGGAMALKAIPNAMSRIVSNSIPDSPLSVWQAKHPHKHDVVRLLKAAFIAISDYRSWMLVETAAQGHERVDGVLEASARPRPEESWRDESLGASSSGNTTPRYERADSIGADSIRADSPRAWDADDERETFYDSSSEGSDAGTEALARRQTAHNETFYDSSSEDFEEHGGAHGLHEEDERDRFFDSSSEDFGTRALTRTRQEEEHRGSHEHIGEESEGSGTTNRHAEDDDAAFLDHLLDADGDRLTSMESDSGSEVDAHTFDRLLDETPLQQPEHAPHTQARPEENAGSAARFHDDWHLVANAPRERDDEAQADAGALVAARSRPQYFVETPEDAGAHQHEAPHARPHGPGPLGSVPHAVSIEEVDPDTRADIQPHFVEEPGSARVFVEGRRERVDAESTSEMSGHTRTEDERDNGQPGTSTHQRPHITLADHLNRARHEDARRSRTEAPLRRDHARQVLEQNQDALRQTIEQLETQRHLENLRDQMQARTQEAQSMRRRRGPLAKVRNAFKKLAGSR